MEQTWETEKRSLSLHVSIKCQGKCQFRVIATDFHVNTKYADRTIEVDGFRTIYLSFVTSPEKVRIIVTPKGNSDNYLVDIKEKPLKTYQVHIDTHAQKFVKFAQEFSSVSGYSSALPQGRYFRTKDKDFAIRYFPFIKHNGAVSTSPARIGHNTGIIEVSKLHFDRCTIPMRMIILLHEYSHKWRNPKIDLEISDEVGADLNALYIYLGLGYSKVDAIYVFANVFYKAQTPQNRHRMRKIMDYIQKFENGEIAKPLTK